MVKHLKIVSKCKNRLKKENKEKNFTSPGGQNKKLINDYPGSFFASSAPAPIWTLWLLTPHLQ